MRVYSGAWTGLVTLVAMNITGVFTVVRGRVLLPLIAMNITGVFTVVRGWVLLLV